jgi:Rab3 GTPase-activating protein catalytic subunit
LTDETVMERWDTVAGNRIAKVFAKKSNVDKATRSLVTALDWNHAAADMIEPWQAQEIVRKVLDDTAPALGFPLPPDSIVSTLIETNIYASMKANGVEALVWQPLLKSAPPGRLLSLLFVHMARVRSPSSMAMVWIAFVQELRRRWEARESLPNLNFVPGLDPPPYAHCSQARQCWSTVGGAAHLSAHVHSSEPDPDDFHCLIGQKLQVFNLGLECVVSAELRQVEQLEKKQRLGTPNEIDRGGASMTTFSRTLLNGAVVDGVPQLDDAAAQLNAAMNVDRDEKGSVASETKSNLSQDFYDADETEHALSRAIPQALYPRLQRHGARCPVQGAFLCETGDQLYAPYLQRPFPLTDDVIAERRLVLSRQGSSGQASTMRQRLEITQRFQKPKLQSDMRAFKAANPGAVFEDFIRWYGEPSEALDVDSKGSTGPIEVSKVPEPSNERTLALGQTKSFWAQTWNEAAPLPAAEQESLFIAESTVEMALDYLETIHPASLLCQILAVNLALSYFILAASAGDTIHVRSLRLSLHMLRENIDEALQCLASDATLPIDNIHKDKSSPEMMATVESIDACTKACASLTAVEVIMSRAASLLHKLPQQYDLVESIMQRKEGASIRIAADDARSSFQKTVLVQQNRLSKADRLKPAVREYLFRNTDERTPCQLCVRTSDEGIHVFGDGRGGTLFALTKVVSDGGVEPVQSPATGRHISSGLVSI